MVIVTQIGISGLIAGVIGLILGAMVPGINPLLTALALALSCGTAIGILTKTECFLHGEEAIISAESGYLGAQKQEELKDIKAD